ncbi:MAG: Holliday junction resolvase RuvX [Leptothrix sp. (in: b-proteobacteria)]
MTAAANSPAETRPEPAPTPSADPAPAVAVRQAQSFLAFDYGQKRTGVASGNRLLGSGRPLMTIKAEGDARFAQIARLIQEWQPDALVVGVPFHPDGAEHDNTRLARRFARQLHGRFRLPVFEVDERYSTTEVLAGGAKDADAAAAALLLEQYFHEQSKDYR